MQKRQTRSTSGLLLGALLVLVPLAMPSPASAGSACLDVRVEYLGRDPVALINNVQYYRWSYRVCGQGCMNRGMSHWALGICAGQHLGPSQISTQSGIGATMGIYLPAFGVDPIAGLNGLKWKFVTGNSIHANGTCHDFSFVASGLVTTVSWTAKAGNLTLSGTTLGPGCDPVPVAPTSWSAIKAIFRS